MFYPNDVICTKGNEATSKADPSEFNLENDNNVCSQKEMMKKIQEVDFAIIDLNLFLDTHPESEEALDLFTKLCATSKSLKKDYQYKYGPLYVENSTNSVPFEWVNKCTKWPWE